MRADFDRLAPHERQTILVVTDETYWELINTVDWGKILRTGLLPSNLIWESILSLRDQSPQVQDRARREHTYERSIWQRATTKGEIPIFHLSPAEAARRFRFDIGGPQDGTAYVLNPCIPDHYLLPALANERLAQEKMAAFTQIASALGARNIELVSIDVMKQGIKVGLKGPIPQLAAAQLGCTVQVDTKGQVIRQLFQEFGRSEKKPFVPEQLNGWLTMDPILRVMVNSRLDGKLERTRVSLSFGETLDLRAKLSAQFKPWKIDVGGEYRQVLETSWTFDVEFWPS